MEGHFFDSVDSTNDLAGRMLRQGRISCSAYIVARAQTRGKGTRGRAWVSPTGAGLYMTVVDRPNWAANGALQAYTRGAGIACAEVIQEQTGVQVRLKPVNDLYVEGRKLGGILTEALIEANRLIGLLTGIGINIRRAPRTLPRNHVVPICLEEVISPVALARIDLKALATRLAEQVVHWHRVVSEGRHFELESRWTALVLSADELQGEGGTRPEAPP